MQHPTQPGPTPHTVRWRCENCAQPLADAYTVCAHCEPEFSTPWDNRWRAPERAQQPALHTCAQCGFGFDVASVRLQPDPAPWWRMQTMAHCCPACRGRLDWIPSAQAHAAEVWNSFSVWGLVSMQWGMQVLGEVRGAGPHRGWWLALPFLLGMVALLWGALQQHKPPHQAHPPAWRATLKQARHWALGRFVSHGSVATPRMPWPVWLVAAALGGLALLAVWLRHRGVPSEWPVGLYVLGNAIVFAALAHATLLRRRALRALGW